MYEGQATTAFSARSLLFGCTIQPMTRDMLHTRPGELRRRPRRLSVCGMCCRRFDGVSVVATRDHIVPRGWFCDPPPPNLPTWRVCRDCQQDLSPREELLRNIFASARAGNMQALRSVCARTERSRQLPTVHKLKLVLSPGNVRLERDRVAIPSQDDLDLVFRKVASGLYLWREGELPADPRFVVRVLSEFGAADFFRGVPGTARQNAQRLGHEFQWTLRQAHTEPRQHAWLFVIYGVVSVAVWHGNSVTDSNIHQPRGVSLRDQAHGEEGFI
jgi:hypothetical protein